MTAETTDKRVFRVCIALPNGRHVPLDEVEHDRESRANYLARYHGNQGNVLCLCRREGIPMGVGRRQVPSVVYYLYPLHRSDPPRHALSCPHHSSLKTEGAAENTESKPVIEVKDGKIHINLGSPLYRGQPTGEQEGEDDKGEPEPMVAGSTRSPRGKLLTLLEVLWSEAELNLWRPWFDGRRHYGVIYHRLTEAAARIRLRNQDLASLLYIPPPFRESQTAEIQADRDRFLGMLSENKGRTYYGYVLGLLREVVDKEGKNIAIRLAHTSMQLWVKKKRWTRAKNKWLADTDMEQPVAIIARVMRHEGKTNPWLTIEEVAMLSLSDEKAWIPVESRFEHKLVTQLVSEGRCFRKPLSCETPAGELLPDFILEDREDRLHMEVLGRMSSPEYRAMIVDKHARYEQIKQAVWWWDTDRDLDVPYLPGSNRSQGIMSGAGPHIPEQRGDQPQFPESR